jgi:predicted nucleotidyltransferase
MANTAQVNSKLLNAFNNGALDLASIASVVRVPESGIYNIYIWGAHLFGTEDVYSDADLIVVADGQTPVRQVKDQGVDIAVYTPQRFQYELEEVVVKMLNESVSSDRVFTVYNSSDQNFKILERMSFLPNGSKDLIKRRAEEFKRERWKAVEEAFFMKDTQSWQKRLWSIFRNLIFLTQFVKDGKITDLNAPKVYLEEITSKRFNDYASLVTYFNPKVESLYSTLLSL